MVVKGENAGTLTCPLCFQKALIFLKVVKIWGCVVKG